MRFTRRLGNVHSEPSFVRFSQVDLAECRIVNRNENIIVNGKHIKFLTKNYLN